MSVGSHSLDAPKVDAFRSDVFVRSVFHLTREVGTRPTVWLNCCTTGQGRDLKYFFGVYGARAITFTRLEDLRHQA